MKTSRANEIPPATDELLAAGQPKLGKARLNLRGSNPPAPTMLKPSATPKKSPIVMAGMRKFRRAAPQL